MSALKGRLSGNRPIFIGKRHAIVLALEDGRWSKESWKADIKFKIGTLYRFYLKKPIAEIRLNSQKPSSRPSSYLALRTLFFVRKADLGILEGCRSG